MPSPRIGPRGIDHANATAVVVTAGTVRGSQRVGANGGSRWTAGGAFFWRRVACRVMAHWYLNARACMLITRRPESRFFFRPLCGNAMEESFWAKGLNCYDNRSVYLRLHFFSSCLHGRNHVWRLFLMALERSLTQVICFDTYSEIWKFQFLEVLHFSKCLTIFFFLILTFLTANCALTACVIRNFRGGRR